jgi:hypothetical protein
MAEICPNPGERAAWLPMAKRTIDGYIVRDANGQALAYLYSRDNPTEALQTKMLTKDEARRIAVDIAGLPELLGKADHD